jgi:phage terminase large subunit
VAHYRSLRYGTPLSVLDIPIARAFLPMLQPARYKAAHGGRGSGKSHFFGGNLVKDHVAIPGLRSVCIRENQKSLSESAKRLVQDKIVEMGVESLFTVRKDHIEAPGGGIIIFQGMQDHTAESIKSLEGFSRAWVEEAQTLSQRSLDLLRPTIREEGSEIWFSWNPRRKADPVDELMRHGTPPSNSIVVKANWSDNPWFPKVLEQERQDYQRDYPDRYDHTWEGGYISTVDGAYYAKNLTQAREEGRIGKVAPDPHLPIKVFIDIGGTGGKSDAFAMWCSQWVAREIRNLNYYEAQGQPVGTHLAWLRKNDYGPDEAEIYLPHDGSTNDRVYDVSYETAFRAAGYKVTVIPNQGKGAASARVDETRRLFSVMWFNEETTKAGLEGLGWYHERKDDIRQIGLGPEHDWSSHGADAFGLMAVAYKPPRTRHDERPRTVDRSHFQ